jgi:ABC-2 type transport system permease protein
VALDVSRRPGPVRRLRDVYRYRELLVNLVRKELKVKYKNSVLGAIWSLANPALYLVVFTLVFQVFLKTGIPDFAIYFLSGLVAWNLFSAGVSGGTGSVVANAALVGKVWFPREILPLAAVGAAMFHFVLQGSVLVMALIVLRHAPSAEYAIALVPAAAVLLLLVSALAIALAAVNVYVRDAQHLLELGLLAWFWMTPIVYAYRLVSDRVGSWVLLNPMTPVVVTFQRAIYNRTTYTDGDPPNQVVHGILPDESLVWYLRNLAIVGVVSLVLLALALTLFGRLEDNFAEEI